MDIKINMSKSFNESNNENKIYSDEELNYLKSLKQEDFKLDYIDHMVSSCVYNSNTETINCSMINGETVSIPACELKISEEVYSWN